MEGGIYLSIPVRHRRNGGPFSLYTFGTRFALLLQQTWPLEGFEVRPGGNEEPGLRVCVCASVLWVGVCVCA